MADAAHSLDTDTDIPALMQAIGSAARAAAHTLANAGTAQKNEALSVAARELRARTAELLEANAKDMATAEARGLGAAMLDRLKLTDERIEAMAAGLESVAALPDPVGATIKQWQTPNGLQFSRVRVPLGVIGIIYESRPNVTADAGALCLKSGNAAILRGGSESFHSSRAIGACLIAGLAEAGLPEACIQLVPTTDRDAVGVMLRMSETIDVIVPRGGRGLIERLIAESKIPLFQHLEGLCHVYLDGAAERGMAIELALNAKMRRTGICGAMETLLVDRKVADVYLPEILDRLAGQGCELRGDAEVCAMDERVKPATDEDWATEYLDAILSVKLVDGVDEAIAHINAWGSHHTDAIVTADDAAAAKFIAEVDSAIVMHNASTQFADGGEFGMGAEIGISTGKLHARGPVALEELTTYKNVVRGTGQARPA